MQEIMEYAILGGLGVIIFLAFIENQVGFLDQAVSALDNSTALSSGEQDTLTGILVVLMLGFVALSVYVIYLAIQKEYM